MIVLLLKLVVYGSPALADESPEAVIARMKEAYASLASYSEREGRLGLMLVTTTEERWVNQRDELLRTSRIHVLRYR